MGVPLKTAKRRECNVLPKAGHRGVASSLFGFERDPHARRRQPCTVDTDHWLYCSLISATTGKWSDAFLERGVL
jgi:hypothetical protein